MAILSQSTVSNNIANGGGGIENSGTLTVTASTLSGNSAVGSGSLLGIGGAIDNAGGTLSVNSSTINGNKANEGGAIENGGTATVTASTIRANSASGNRYSSGGGIDIAPGKTLRVAGSIFDGNSASYQGGGIFNFGTLIVAGSTFSSNSSPQGGGVYNYFVHATLSLINSTFRNNVALQNGDGGGVYNDGGRVHVISSTFSANAASVGAGIDNDFYGTLDVSNTVFISNTAGTSKYGGSGGGIYNNGGTLNVVASNFTRNVASSDGGGIEDYGYVSVTTSTFDGNSAGFRGGGIDGGTMMTITYSAFDHNSATVQGGGLENGGTATVAYSTFTGNSAGSGGTPGYGGGIDNYQYYTNALTVTNSLINDNSATYGGGIGNSNNGGTANAILNVSNSTITGNTASISGGSLYNYNGGMALLAYDTVASNGSGIDNTKGSAITLTGSIVANTVDGPNCSGPITDSGYNLDSGTSCGFGQSTDISNTNPLLGPPANNGGPTQTMAELPGSPAIDHGGSSATGCPPTDQRDLRRPDESADGGGCDIGAFESQSESPSLTVNPSSGSYQQSITLTGTNFAANEIVNIYGDSTSHAPLYSPTTNAAGSFVLPTTADQGPYGRNTLIAVGQTSGLSATAPFTIVPSSTVQPTGSVQGGHAVLSGYGFAAHEQVSTFWSARGGPVLGILTTNVYGTFAGSGALTFTAPLSPTGSYALVSVGLSSGAVATSTFTIKPSLRIAPSSGAHGSAATVAGTGYGAHETVTVRWNCTGPPCPAAPVLGSALTDNNGDFTGLAVTIPTTATVGTYPVGGLGASSGAFTRTYYTVTS